MLHLYHHEDGGGAEVEGIQPVDQVELESHADQGEEEAKVEETHEPGDRIQNKTPANNRDWLIHFFNFFFFFQDSFLSNAFEDSGF